MAQFKSFLSFFFLVYSFSSSPVSQMVIITASYNNAEWVEKYFNSLAQQTFNDWITVYIDDCSTDGTFEIMESLVKTHGMEKQFVLMKNKKRLGHLLNQYSAIYACTADSIIVILDGDDWLAHEHALQTIHEAYADGTTWLTYGQFWYLKKDKKGFCKPIPPEVIEKNDIRAISWRTSHPRTFYAGLFHQIKFEDLLYEGYFYPKCADVATMFPMIEMAGTHVKFIPDILYIYNDNNPISYHHDPSEQRKIEAYLKTKERYAPLKEKPW